MNDYLVGINPVEAALEHDPRSLIEVIVEQGVQNRRVKELADQARKLGLTVSLRSRDELERLAAGVRHQGIVAQYRRPAEKGEADLATLIAEAGDKALFLVLDGVQDPHNLGACLRSAEAAGVTAVLVPKDKAVGMTPIVQRASAGAADRVPLLRVTNLTRALGELKAAGIWISGLDGTATQSLYQSDLRGAVALVLGSEGEGMRRLTRENCDFLIKIPMRGKVESLNVSVATGIVLFEALRQRGG